MSINKTNEEIQACKKMAEAALKAKHKGTFCIGKSPKVVGKALLQEERERLRREGKDTSTKKRNNIGKRGKMMQRLKAFDGNQPKSMKAEPATNNPVKMNAGQRKSSPKSNLDGQPTPLKAASQISKSVTESAVSKKVCIVLFRLLLKNYYML